jgi:tetratricopeptide (TPR) repeat protein
MLVTIVAMWSGVRSFFFDTLATRLDTNQPGANQIVDSLTSAADWDPNAHLLAARYYESTFDAMGLGRTVAEYRRATELAPEDYTVWLQLAESLSRSGDAGGAETAFARASTLAPNYAAVQWAYGNFLIRQGRNDEAFPLITQAAIGDEKLSSPAVATVLQITDGDVAKTRQLLGNEPTVNAALSQTLAAMKNYDGALSAWQSLSPEMRSGKYREVGTRLVSSLLGATRFRAAAAVASDLADSDAAKPVVGKVMNGDFESGVKLRKAGDFEWQIGDGGEPKIGLSPTHHGGQYSLGMTFSSFKAEDYREVSQLIAVDPSARYRLDLWYRSTLKSDAKFKWQVMDAATNAVLATTTEMGPADDWTSISVPFVVPDSVDGIRVRLLREGCGGAVCAASGTIMFDDIGIGRQ